jgi:hypothetical protein
MWSSRWNENWQRKPKYSEKTFLNTTLSTTNPTWSDLGSNPGRRGGKPATNSLSYGTAYRLSKLMYDQMFIIYCFCILACLSIYGSTALVDLGRFSSFLIYSRYDSLDGGSARRNVAAYTQNSINTE